MGRKLLSNKRPTRQRVNQKSSPEELIGICVCNAPRFRAGNHWNFGFGRRLLEEHENFPDTGQDKSVQDTSRGSRSREPQTHYVRYSLLFQFGRYCNTQA
jgi:hypothetical protein